MAFSSAKRALSLSSILLITTPSILLAAGYYGQNSYGATHGSSVYSQQFLSTYCQDDALDVIPLAFLHIFFSSGGLPEIDLANTCNSNNGNVFPGTKLAVCHQLTDDIKTCQKRGKLVTMSLGGATGSTAFSSDAQARTFAETIWNLFLGGSSDTRPFGDAVLDGVDLDLESGSGTDTMSRPRPSAPFLMHMWDLLSSQYIHNNVVAHNGHKWTAGWWSIGDLPGGVVGVWEDNGPCSPSAKFRRLPRVLKH
ncbi:hypothetical protein C0993_008305 [Termitomyces sp. T159_Od127]|nr:hypothetical protein C0993_008305 [Termitomyces sp. T159_Od127]